TLMRYHLGIAYIETQQRDKAMNTLAELIKIDPNYWDAYYRLGELLFADGQPDKARQILETLLEKNPSYEKREQVEQLLS
ncbi:MAG: tetratricopeptide repeat protein, partial [Sediminispirochaetaceae bacterium]